MAIYYPPIFINKYLTEKISGTQELPGALSEYFARPMKFFPSSPTDINALTESFPEASNDVFAVYDRMFKMRRYPFPHIKCEQLLYYFYKMSGNLEALIETTQIVNDLLDSGDESAQEINQWISKKVDGTIDIVNPINGITETFNKVNFDGTDFLLPHFHYIKIFQLEETRDIIDFGTARTYAGNKIIIDYDWHKAGKV
jgi:hypothetical protein